MLALLAWAFFPVILLAVHADATHAVWTGANGLIGADGVLGADQLQYLAWARGIADHGLAADLFTLGPSGHVFLEPVSGVVGGLQWLGVPLIVGALAATAFTAVGLGLAAAAWARRLEPGSAAAQLGVIALALFTVTPAAALVNWAQIGSARFRFEVYLAGDELLAATKLWGYAPAVLALVLLTFCLLALERGLRAPVGVRGRTRVLAPAGLAGLLTAWAHPWQGITLALILGGVAVLRPRWRERFTVLGVLSLTLLPLVYYGVLSHVDPAWQVAAHNEAGGRLRFEVLALCLGPLLAVGAFGVRRPRGALAEQALLLWVPAALITYAVQDAFATHALQGISLPFAVLAVRGTRRLRMPALLGAACVLLLTVPGLAYDARKFVRVSQSPLVQYALPDSDAAALRFLARAAPAGGVLAPTPFASVIPARTGRAVWVGHGDWSPHYKLRARAAARLFDRRMDSPSAARDFGLGTGARILVADCAHRATAGQLGTALGAEIARARRFGCATVWVLRRPG